MTYYRYTNEESAISDYTGFGMFAINEGRVSECYGANCFIYDGTDGVDINDMHDRFLEAWEECKDNAPDYMQELTGEEFFKAFDPEDIVEDAEAWDNGDFRRFFVEFIYDDEAAILLTDGAIVFDENLVK